MFHTKLQIVFSEQYLFCHSLFKILLFLVEGVQVIVVMMG